MPVDPALESALRSAGSAAEDAAVGVILLSVANGLDAALTKSTWDTAAVLTSVAVLGRLPEGTCARLVLGAFFAHQPWRNRYSDLASHLLEHLPRRPLAEQRSLTVAWVRLALQAVDECLCDKYSMTRVRERCACVRARCRDCECPCARGTEHACVARARKMHALPSRVHGPCMRCLRASMHASAAPTRRAGRSHTAGTRCDHTTEWPLSFESSARGASSRVQSPQVSLPLMALQQSVNDLLSRARSGTFDDETRRVLHRLLERLSDAARDQHLANKGGATDTHHGGAGRSVSPVVRGAPWTQAPLAPLPADLDARTCTEPPPNLTVGSYQSASDYVGTHYGQCTPPRL